MYQKAPWLYNKFETPESSIQRPAFLDDEEGKTGEKDEERKLRRQQIALALEEKRKLEEAERIAAEEEKKFQKDQEEKHQLARQIEMLVNENMSLRKDFEEMAKAKAPRSVRPQDEDHKKDKQVRKLLEENLLLKSRLLRLEDSKPEEDAGAFATPNGSAEQDDPGPKASEETGEERRFEEGGRGKGKGSPEGQKPKDDQVPPQTLDVILKLMEGMQEIQKKLVKGGGGEEEEAEVVRHAVELPRLPEWCSETGPIDYSDWLLLLSPIMSDLSPTSEEWWTQMLATATQWYENHLKLSIGEVEIGEVEPSTGSYGITTSKEVDEIGKKIVSVAAGGDS